MSRFPPIFILRHGETEWNRAGRMQGQLDSPLTERGRDQAARQGEILNRLGVPENIALWSSPLGRAEATARIVFSSFGRDFRRDHRLMEVSVGACEGLTHAEIEERYPGTVDRLRPFEWYFESPGAETVAELRKRVGAFLADLIGHAVVVTHGITSRFLRAEVLGRDWRDLGSADGGQGVVYELRDGYQVRHAED